MPTIPTATYESIYNQYIAAMKWMEMLGIKLSSGRTTHYERILRHWKDKYETATEIEAEEIFPDFVNSMVEVFDFISIYNAFHNMPLQDLENISQKLQKGVNGPLHAFEETSNSTSARNFLFEVSVAARAHYPIKNVVAILDAQSDTGVKLNGKKLWIECKRVTNLERIRPNVRKASSQLEVVLGNKIGSGHRGIVALDITKILNKGDKILVTEDDDELIASTGRMIERFIEDYSHIWQEVYERRKKKIIGTLIRFSFMSTSESRNLLVHTAQWAINPRSDVSRSDELLQRQLATILEGTS